MILTLVLAATGLARITRLIIDDTILDRPRLWWTLRLPPFWVYLLGCPWCLSVWLAAPTALGIAYAYRSWPLLLAWPSLSYATILGYVLVDRIADRPT